MSKKTIKKYIVLEIEVDRDIDTKYPNFIFNYRSPEEFMANEIGCLNKNIPLEEVICYKNYSPFFGDEMTKKEQKKYLKENDVGYRYKVLKVSNTPYV